MKSITNAVVLPKKQPERIFELDFLRGLFIIKMCCDHLYQAYNYYFYELKWERIHFLNTIHNSTIVQFITTVVFITNNNFLLQMFQVDGGKPISEFTNQGVTLTFSHHNKKRVTGFIKGFIIYYTLLLLEMAFGGDIAFFSFFNFEVFWAYILCMLTFMFIIKLPFNIQLWISGLLGVGTVFSIFIFNVNPTFNPLHWFGIIDNLPNPNIFKLRVFPFVFLWSIGTIVGQTYYKDRISPFNLYHLNHKKIFKPILWCSKYALRIFIAHSLLIPLLFFILYLVF